MGWFSNDLEFYKQHADKLKVEVEFWKIENGKNVNTAEQLLKKLERNMAELNKLYEEVKFKNGVIETLKKDIKFLSDRQKEKTDMTKDEAREIIQTLKGWNKSQKSLSYAFDGVRVPEDDIYDAQRAALAKAWKTIGEL